MDDWETWNPSVLVCSVFLPRTKNEKKWEILQAEFKKESFDRNSWVIDPGLEPAGRVPGGSQWFLAPSELRGMAWSLHHKVDLGHSGNRRQEAPPSPCLSLKRRYSWSFLQRIKGDRNPGDLFQLLPLAFAVSEQKERQGSLLSNHPVLQESGTNWRVTAVLRREIFWVLLDGFFWDKSAVMQPPCPASPSTQRCQE